jgi:type IV pilus assembly protein PilP
MNRARIAPVLVALTLTACGSGLSDLEKYAAEVKGRKSTAIPPIPQVKQFESFAYVPGDRRDPFVASQPEASANAAGPRPDMNRNREPLEEFPLDGLRMAGTLQTPAGLFALVKAPDGVIHRITTKNYMGQNYGQIVAISSSEIKLQELVPDGFGGWVQRDASLALSD